jgi:hypothetical protein
MDFACNLPSIEEISFKLTENYIPSLAHLVQDPQSRNSLDYTLSRVSLHMLLAD